VTVEQFVKPSLEPPALAVYCDRSVLAHPAVLLPAERLERAPVPARQHA
jgi:hypothetical protein